MTRRSTVLGQLAAACAAVMFAVPVESAVSMPAVVRSTPLHGETEVKWSVRELANGAADAARAGALDLRATALADALRAEIAGKSPKVIARFAASDAGRFAIFQWRLLANLSAEERAALTTQHANAIAWLISDPVALELFLTSGDVAGNRWAEALRIFASIASQDPDVMAESPKSQESAPAARSLPLRLAVATALTHATPVQWMADGTTIDPVQRYQSFRAWEREGVLFPSFRELSAWEMRYVVGSWSSDDDLVWARANIKPELKVRDKVGDAAHMLGYNLVNARGVSVQEGGKFYDNKPMTLAIMLEYGGVCGAISRFGSSMSQAFGVPAMPVGQPGHCAFIWQQQPAVWAINNDISGWAESNRHDGIHITWANDSVGSAAWLIPLMQDAQRDLPAFGRSEAVRVAAEFSDPDDRGGTFAEACELSKSNFAAWVARFTELATPSAAKNAKRAKVTKPAAWKDALADAAKALARQPLAFDVLLRMAEPAMLPANAAAKIRTQHAEEVARTALAMLASGADLGVADALVGRETVRQARAIALSLLKDDASNQSVARAEAFVRGDLPARDGKQASGACVTSVLELAFDVVGTLDVAKEGAAHELWRRSLSRAARGAVLCDEFRAAGLRRIEALVAALGRAGRVDDARWLADRLVEAAKQLKEAASADAQAAEVEKELAKELEAKLAAFRASLG